MPLDMASNDASSASMESTVRVLVSFFLATDETSSARSTGATHKEKFNVPLSEDHKDLFKFQKYLKTFTGLDDIAISKGLGENPEVTIARVKKASSGSGVETFSCAHAYRKTHHAFISGSFIVLRYEELIPFCPQHT